MHVQVVIKYEDDNKIVENNGIRRKIIDKLVHSELAGKYFAYDGEKSFFTVGPLPQDIFDFIVVLEEVSSRFILFLSFFFGNFALGFKCNLLNCYYVSFVDCGTLKCLHLSILCDFFFFFFFFSSSVSFNVKGHNMYKC